MAEKIISPGVFTNEIDQSFLPSAVADIGAALIGPTLKGPAGIPTVVTSFSEFQAKFGDVFKSGSDSVQFLTSHAAEQYLRNSDTLTVVRIMDGTFGPGTADIGNNTGTSTATFTFSDKRIIEERSSVEIAKIVTLFKLMLFSSIKFSKILKLTNVQKIHTAIKGISFGLNSDWPNKYGYNK